MKFDRIKFIGLRVAGNISQEKMAAALGVARATLIKWEKGRGEPGLKELNAAAKELGIRAEDLVTREAPQERRNGQEGKA